MPRTVTDTFGNAVLQPYAIVHPDTYAECERIAAAYPDSDFAAVWRALRGTDAPSDPAPDLDAGDPAR